ncbi:hypothetical protein Gogos_003977 [Gossypium gossypioides]|uniref:Uncharacterized protein n=1 Tax=Gossypium gossypioides TaxID=34282 RepID=A0A7J9CNN3_GOSGO|nr:hypothetical protein [Gossypium gossypioides]
MRKCTVFESDNLEVVRALHVSVLVDSRITVFRRVQTDYENQRTVVN